MSFPLTIKSLPMWKANDYGLLMLAIIFLSLLAKAITSNVGVSQASMASGNSSSPSPILARASMIFLAFPVSRSLTASSKSRTTSDTLLMQFLTSSTLTPLASTIPARTPSKISTTTF